MTITNLRELQSGDIFNFAGYDFIVLNQCKETMTTFVVTKDCIGKEMFDVEGNNNFEFSSLRRYLNDDFLVLLENQGLNINDIAPTCFDLKNNKSHRTSICKEYIGLLSLEEYQQYKHLLGNIYNYWLVTPNAFSKSAVMIAAKERAVFNYDFANLLEKGVRPSLSIKWRDISC